MPHPIRAFAAAAGQPVATSTIASPGWPLELRSAHARLREAIASGPTESRRCVECAIALGAACRAARLSGRATCVLLNEAIGCPPPCASTREFVGMTSCERLMLLAIDAYYDVPR